MIREKFARNRLRAAVAATVAGVVGVALVPAGPAQAATAQGGRISWTACRDGFECATVPAPLDYDRPGGATISLSVIRMPAGLPNQKIGSLFINPGGPGGSGVDVVRAIANLLPLELRGHFDIVGFDPRGIARSTPLRCFDTFDEALAVLPPFPFPYTRQEEDVQQASDNALAGACASKGGAIRDHMSTADVARDMDLLRRAVGDSKLTYLGFSYGSFLGQTYANLFPNRVRAIVIDGVLDPIAWTTGRGDQATTLPFSTRLHSDDGAQRTLDEFFRLCDAAGPDCAFSGNSRQRYAALAARLKETPIVIEDPNGGTITITYAILVNVTLGALYSPQSWPDLAGLLKQLEDLANPAAVGQSLATLRAKLGVDVAAQEEYPNVIEGPPGVYCSDSVNPKSFDAWRLAAAEADQRFGYFGRPWTWLSSVCLPWPTSAGQDRYLGPWTARTSSPVLVVGNYFDPATRYQGAVTASRLLPNSRLLSYAGWGHAAFFVAGNFCIDNYVTRYLVTTKVPPVGTVCQPQGVPFGPSALAQSADRAALTAATLPQPVRRSLHGN
jgi:pimeloyl-ACP methyl ester carboxylesterase